MAPNSKLSKPQSKNNFVKPYKEGFVKEHTSIYKNRTSKNWADQLLAENYLQKTTHTERHYPLTLVLLVRSLPARSDKMQEVPSHQMVPDSCLHLAGVYATLTTSPPPLVAGD